MTRTTSPGVLDQPSVIVWSDADEWRWRCEKCGERSKAAFTSEFDAALDAGRHDRDTHAVPVDLSPGWTKRLRRTLASDESSAPPS
jgi:hypothetical protein